MYDSEVNLPLMRVRRSFAIGLLAIVALAVLLPAETADFDGRPAIVLRNDKLELTILVRGATLANLVLRDSAEKLSPYWNTDRALRAAGSSLATPAGALGHFLCLDGFGAPSEEERTAGMPFHGEASGRQFETVAESGRVNSASSVKLRAHLPLAQEDITRTMTLLDGENVIYVSTEVENLLAIDRPYHGLSMPLPALHFCRPEVRSSTFRGPSAAFVRRKPVLPESWFMRKISSGLSRRSPGEATST
jgi:hypothetical protein